MGLIATESNLQMTNAGVVGKATGGVGLSVLLSAADLRTLLSVYTISQTDSAISVAVAALVDSSPGVLNTLNELAEALGDDANFSATVSAAIAAKYSLPGSGIPAGDLSAAVQASLARADSALQSVPNETIDDRVAALLVAGSNVTLTYDDGLNTLTIAAASGGAYAWGKSLSTIFGTGY